MDMRLGRIQNDTSAKGFDLVKNSGLDFIEICCNYEKEMDRVIAEKDQIRAQIERTGIPVSSIGRWNHDVQANGVIDQAKAKRYADLMDTAIELGAKTFVCGCNYDQSVSLFRNYANAIDFLRGLLEHADGRINVAVANCSWSNFIVSPAQWEVVLGELPDLMLKFDASHSYNRRSDYLAELSDWGKRVAHIHIKGTVHAGTKGVDDPPAGMDDIAWSSLFAILYSRGYDGDLSIEPHSAAWNGARGEAGVAFTRDFIRKFMI